MSGNAGIVTILLCSRTHMQSDELPNPESKIYVRVESHIDFPTQCLIMTLASGGLSLMTI